MEKILNMQQALIVCFNVSAIGAVTLDESSTTHYSNYFGNFSVELLKSLYLILKLDSTGSWFGSQSSECSNSQSWSNKLCRPIRG